MKPAGAILLTVALILAAIALFMDTSVNGYHNLSLASRQQNYLLLAAALGVVGALLFTFGGSHGVSQAADDERECPFCAERIKARATVCRFCSREVPPVLPIADRELSQAEPVGPMVTCNKCGTPVLESKANHFLNRKWCDPCFEQAIG